MKDDQENDLDEAEETFFTGIWSTVLYFCAVYKKYVIIIALACVGYFLLNQDYSHVLEDAVTAKPLEGTVWDEDYAKKLISESEESIEPTVEALDRYKFEEAIDTYGLVDSELGKYSRRFRGEVLPNQETVGSEYQRVLKPFQQAILSMAEKELNKMRNGGGATLVYNALERDFYSILSENQRTELAAKFDETDRARADLALNWIRIKVKSNNDTYLNLLKDELRKAWSSYYGFELVFGDALGPREERATWRTYLLSCEETSEEYAWPVKDETDLKQALIAPPTLPVGLQAHIKALRNNTNTYQTTWDQLKLIDVLNSTPDTLDVSGNTLKAIARVNRTKEAYQEKLIEQINTLLVLPKFEIALNPLTKPELLSATGSTLVNTFELGQFALNNRAAFITQSQQWLQDPSFNYSLEVLLVYLELNLTQCTDHLLAVLPSLGRSEVQRLVAFLATKPWWGDYRPAFTLLDSAYSPSNVAILEALADNYEEPVVRAQLLDLLSKADHSSYQVLAKEVVENCPQEDLAVLKSYLSKIEPSVAAVLFSEIYSRDETLAVSWMLELLTKMPKHLQYSMIARHQIGTWAQASLTEMLAKYQIVYEQVTGAGFEDESSQRIQTLILEKIKPLLSSSEVHSFALSLDLTTAPTPLQIEFTKELLLKDRRSKNSVYYADCFALLLKYADSESELHRSQTPVNDTARKDSVPKITQTLLRSILGWNELSETLKQQVLSFFSARSNDPYLLGIFLKEIDSCEWDWTQDSMIKVLEAGCRNPDFSYKTYYRIFGFPEETKEHYEKVIAEGLADDTGSERARMAKKSKESTIEYRVTLGTNIKNGSEVSTEWATIAEGLEMRLTGPEIAKTQGGAEEFFIQCEVRNSGPDAETILPGARFFLLDANQRAHTCQRSEVAKALLKPMRLAPGESVSWKQDVRTTVTGKVSALAQLDAFQGQIFQTSLALRFELIRDSQLEEPR